MPLYLLIYYKMSFTCCLELIKIRCEIISLNKSISPVFKNKKNHLKKSSEKINCNIRTHNPYYFKLYIFYPGRDMLFNCKLLK